MAFGPQSSEEDAVDPLRAPERPDRTDDIGGGNDSLTRDRHHRAQRPGAKEHDADEEELPDLDADIERQQRQRDVARRQAQLAQGPGEAEAMQQAEGEGDDPGPADREGGD